MRRMFLESSGTSLGTDLERVDPQGTGKFPTSLTAEYMLMTRRGG